MRTSARLGAGVCMALAAMSLRPPAAAGQDAPPGSDKVQIKLLEPRDESSGMYIQFEGTAKYPQGVVLACEIRYFERLVPGAGLYSRVKKGRFAAKVGPLPNRLLPGTYQAIVRFAVADQIRELFSVIADESDAVYTSDLNVGTAEEIRAFEQKYRDTARALLKLIDARVKELDEAYSQGSKGKRWVAKGKLDRDACISWTQSCEQAYHEDVQTLDPFCEGAVPYQPDLTELMLLSTDSFHVIASAQMKKLFLQSNAALPDEYAPTRIDVPAEILVKQMIDEALQPVRDYLGPPKGEDR